MKSKPPQSLSEMAAGSAGGGRLTCPRCECQDFRVYKTTQGQAAVFRYKACRHCGYKVVTTTQSAERIVRSVTGEDERGEADFSSSGT